MLAAAAAAPAQFAGAIGGVSFQIGARDHGHHERGPVLLRDPFCDPRPRGHWETVSEEVFVPGYWREECIPATYGWVRDRCGRLRWEVVVPERHTQVWVPGHCETRTRQVWVRC